jgi:tripartite-type tricarboxylate transporter receptor subunit TctC
VAQLIFAPAKKPKPIVDTALKEMLENKAIAKRTEDHGAGVATGTPAELGALVKIELAKCKGVVQRAKLTAD